MTNLTETYQQDEIRFYRCNEPYGFLSNFWKCEFFLNGKLWISTEHYYQAFKTTNLDEREFVRIQKKPNDARTVGQKITLRADFDSVKDAIMLKCLIAKFTQNQNLLNMLLETTGKYLTEDSPVDYYWGIGKDGSGKNILGKQLMQVREFCGGFDKI